MAKTNKFKINVVAVLDSRSLAVVAKNFLITNPRRRRICLNENEGVSGRNPISDSRHLVVSIANRGRIYYGVTRNVNTYIDTMFGTNKGTRRYSSSCVGNAISTFGVEAITTAKSRVSRQIESFTNHD